jgi:hypothetical protein
MRRMTMSLRDAIGGNSIRVRLDSEACKSPIARSRDVLLILYTSKPGSGLELMPSVRNEYG